MPIPSSINDLSTTAASNYPSGSEDLGTADDYLRTYASYIAALRDAVLAGTANLSTANLTYTGTLTGSTGVLNIGSGQIYKDAGGNFGIGCTPATQLEVRNATQTTVRSSTPSVQVDVQASESSLFGVVRTSTNHPLLLGTNGTERMRIDISGNQINTPSNTPPTLTVNGQMNITPTSNTNVRISYRGSDGTTRTANITLA